MVVVDSCCVDGCVCIVVDVPQRGEQQLILDEKTEGNEL